ncbi:hypothetical protein LUZ61_012953 [Rhynchospora tenuis]|uniref:Eukaryotic translation initiation factor 2 subunit beta n=1 Tax=Rhynchospora tenuis TaxID=198213 RepID=A0AAD6A409_9POAL|nr:hypothetical protein LUZ61_012953 [Rhynchospora tenuis]
MEKVQEISENVGLQDSAKEADKYSAEKMIEQTREGSGTSFGEKKKRRKKLVDTSFIKNEGSGAGNRNNDEHVGENSGQNSNNDYTYVQLVGRVFKILKEKNLLAKDRRKAVLQAPRVFKDGSKKTVLANFIDLCKSMHRQPDHVMAFFLAEAGTTGSLDGQQRLVVKSRLQSKNFEGLICNYMAEYVLCQACKSKNTILNKEARMFFLRCEQCGSSRTVAPVKTGYVARVGR